MKCRQFRKLASLYVDTELESNHQRALAQHLVHCQPCQTYVRQIRALSEQLGHLSRPRVSPQLLGQALAAYDDVRQERGADAVVRAINWAVMHSRSVSAVASFLITIVCYGGILGQLKPLPYLPSFTQAESIKLTSSQYDWVNGRDASEAGPGFYTFPRVQKISQTDSSLAEINATPIVVIALIQSDGRASLVEVLQPRSNPQLVAQVQTALGNLRFRPATTGGRAVPTQLVLMMERMDIRG